MDLSDSTRKGSATALPRLIFGVTASVGPWAYLCIGLTGMLLKYAVEAGVLWWLNESVLTPWQFLSPVLSTREVLIRPQGTWLAWAWMLWTLPFLWVAASMSVRRAADAGRSPWFGLIVLVPLVNLVGMAVLSLLPSQQAEPGLLPSVSRGDTAPAKSAALGVAISLVVGGVMLWVSVYLLSVYGASLFLGTPLVMGAIASYVANTSSRCSWGASATVGLASVFFAGLALLLFALEGVICVAMAMPLLLPLGAMGGLLGRIIADATRIPSQGWIAAAIALPLLASGEAMTASPLHRVVLTTIEIDAPPEVVWQNVIAFPELPQARAWYFNWGIACPERATIAGQGVGAVRYCHFTTGTFVEPITVWDAPTRLAFDVASQPDPMTELSPYRGIHPPHLGHSVRSTRGEFRLLALPHGRTRLEGRTWYTMDMYPGIYWSLWSDACIAGIHERVLAHIQSLAELPSRSSTASPAPAAHQSVD